MRDAVDVMFKPAGDADLPFARSLARKTMMPYYTRHGLLWQDADFDAGWSWRENHLLVVLGEVVGFVSLSADARALYIRELHLVETARRRGIGAVVLDDSLAIAAQRRLPRLRLMVFKDNPARRLYERKGLAVVGEDLCFWRMERAVPMARRDGD